MKGHNKERKIMRDRSKRKRDDEEGNTERNQYDDTER